MSREGDGDLAAAMAQDAPLYRQEYLGYIDDVDVPKRMRSMTTAKNREISTGLWTAGWSG
jgi:hypothetical protein